MSSPWDALARNVGRAPSVQELESLVTGTSSLNRARPFGTDGEPGGGYRRSAVHAGVR